MVDTKNQVQGFLGWSVTSKDKAEAWLEGRGGQSDDDSFDGPSIIFNAWVANNDEVNRFLLQEARKIVVGKDTIYFKRYYKDGSTRPMRLRFGRGAACGCGATTAATGSGDGAASAVSFSTLATAFMKQFL